VNRILVHRSGRFSFSSDLPDDVNFKAEKDISSEPWKCYRRDRDERWPSEFSHLATSSATAAVLLKPAAECHPSDNSQSRKLHPQFEFPQEVIYPYSHSRTL
jgi:hypothetical protein